MKPSLLARHLSAALAGALVLLPAATAATPAPVAPSARPTAGAPSQEPGATEALPSGREVVEAFARKSNGEAFERSTSMHLTGRAEIEGLGLTGTFQRRQARPDRMHMTLELSGVGTILVGADAGTSWVVHPLLGPYVQEGCERLQALAGSAYDAARRPEALYETVETVGRRTFEGQECWDVVTVLKRAEGMDAEATRELRTTHELYAVDSGLLVGRETTAATPNGPTPTTIVLSDYTDFGGMLAPKRTEQRAGGVTIVFTIDRVEYDGVTPDAFAPPKAIRTLLEAERAEAKAGAPPAGRR